MLRTFPRAGAGLPATFWWLFAGQGVMSLATFVFPFLALFLASRGLPPGRTGLVMALFGAGSIPAGMVAGALTDRLGRRPTLIGALLVNAVLTAALPVLSSPLAIAAATLALGVATSAYWPAANAAIADVLPQDRYADAYGLIYWERNAGMALSFVLGGMLAAHGYGRLFLADAVTTAVFAALVWSRVPETRPRSHGQAVKGAHAVQGERGWGTVLADGDLLVLLAVFVTLLVAMFQFMLVLPPSMAARGLGPVEYGRAMAMNGIGIVLLQPIAGRFTRGRKDGHVLALAALLAGLGNGAYALCQATWHYVAATALWTVGEVLMVPTVTAIVSRLAPPDLRGRYQGLFGLAYGTGLTLAPALGGAVLGSLGTSAVWAGTAAIGSVVALGSLAASGRWARRTAGGGDGANAETGAA